MDLMSILVNLFPKPFTHNFLTSSMLFTTDQPITLENIHSTKTTNSIALILHNDMSV